MSLYLKYRPHDFSSVVSQTHVVQTLENTLKQNSLAHAYLFCGPRGTGKTSLARIVAKSLNCTNRQADSAEPCHTCQICSDIGQGRLVDLIEIDAASNRGIDEIRELRDKIVFTPTQAKAKVYIIDEVHMLTKEAFNALLKTLEEPPEHAYFILATTEAHKIPETIVSRCQQFTFKRIENNDIVNRLKHIAQEEGIEAEENALYLIAKAAHGGLRDAIGLLEQMAASGAVNYEAVSGQLGVSGHVVMEKFEDALMQQNPLKAIELLNQVHAQGKSLAAFLEEWVGHLREQMLIRLDHPGDVKQYIQWIELFTTAKQQLSQAIIPQLPIEIAVVRACDFYISGSESSTTENSNRNQSTSKKTEVRKEEVAVKKVEIKEVKIESKAVPPPVGDRHAYPLQGEGSQFPIAEKKEPMGAENQPEPKTVPVGVQDPEPLQEKQEEAQQETISKQEKESGKESISEITEIQEKSANPPNVSLDLPTIQKKWAELLGAVDTPFIKMSLMDGKPVKLEENTLHLEFNSATLMDKIESTVNQAIVMKAFEETFSAQPVLKLSVRKITLSPTVAKVEEKKVEVAVASKQEGGEVVEMAQEVFGIRDLEVDT